ncbi:MAG: hypothetical protein P8O20_01200 [Bacteroidia bacterium]|nr:hypothetical protein [Bacteroidia bacterium]
MDNSSDKLRHVLNELAILNQPEQKNGMIHYGISQLKQIKNLCSQAYILSDLSVSESSQQFMESEIAEKGLNSINDDSLETQTPLEEPQEEVKEIPISEAEPEVQESVKPLMEQPVSSNKDKSSENFSKGVSMTRRFEYINKLFRGDIDSYATFVSNLEKSNLTEALMAYEDMYNQLEWNRKQESADEFKRLIIKFFE